MTTMVKAKDLRDGDMVLLDDGTIAKVVRNRTVKVTIPKRKVTKHNIVVEASKRKSGVSTKRTDIMVAWDDAQFQIEDRQDFKSRATRFKDTHGGYINAFSAGATGALITLVTGLTGITDNITSAGMFGVSILLAGYLAMREYTNERVNRDKHR